jgi:hypothetical protein
LDVKPRSFRSALDQLLEPLGFERHGDQWLRQVGDIQECLALDTSNTLGTTINVGSVDAASKAILVEATGQPYPSVTYWIDVRIGDLIDGVTRRWRSGRDDPADLADAVEEYALPFLETVRSLDAQANYFGRSGIGKGTWSHAPSRLFLAITLHRMGEAEEACRAITEPSKRLIPSWQVKVDQLKRHLGCKT